MSGQQASKPVPSKDILRIALLKCVKGKILQKGCIQLGKLSIEKKVPANKNCGSVMIFAKGGMVLSFLATPLTIKPNPINNIKAIKLKTIMFAKVTHPLTNVNLKAKCPMAIITTAVIN